jgi:hypothetical protein
MALRGPLADNARGQVVGLRKGASHVTCLFALQRNGTNGPAYVRNKKAASRRLFESIALNWEVELRGFEPRTSCMPYTRGPSPVMARGRPEGI